MPWPPFPSVWALFPYRQQWRPKQSSDAKFGLQVANKSFLLLSRCPQSCSIPSFLRKSKIPQAFKFHKILWVATQILIQKRNKTRDLTFYVTKNNSKITEIFLYRGEGTRRRWHGNWNVGMNMSWLWKVSYKRSRIFMSSFAHFYIPCS